MRLSSTLAVNLSLMAELFLTVDFHCSPIRATEGSFTLADQLVALCIK